jgi:hypothetical protein
MEEDEAVLVVSEEFVRCDVLDGSGRRFCSVGVGHHGV